MAEVDSSKRYDCFVSFYGPQRLVSLGLPQGRDCGTVHDFVDKLLIPRLRNVDGRKPSVFQSSAYVRGQVSAVGDVMLQLRGGGYALVLLTADFLGDDRSLAELRALLSLAKLKDNPARKDEAIEVGFVCLESFEDQRAINSFDRKLQRFKGDHWLGSLAEGVQRYEIHKLEHHETPERVAETLAEPVKAYWSSNALKPNLGENENVSFMDMERVFVNGNVRMLGRELNVTVENDYGVHDVLARARRDGTITFRKVEKLLEICDHRYELNAEVAIAVRAYKRKWCSMSWSWSAETRDRLCSLAEGVRPDTPDRPENTSNTSGLPPVSMQDVVQTTAVAYYVTAFVSAADSVASTNGLVAGAMVYFIKIVFKRTCIRQEGDSQDAAAVVFLDMFLTMIMMMGVAFFGACIATAMDQAGTVGTAGAVGLFAGGLFYGFKETSDSTHVTVVSSQDLLQTSIISFVVAAYNPSNDDGSTPPACGIVVGILFYVFKCTSENTRDGGATDVSAVWQHMVPPGIMMTGLALFAVVIAVAIDDASGPNTAFGLAVIGLGLFYKFKHHLRRS